MGAASSISNENNNMVYVSYDSSQFQNDYLDTLLEKLLEEGLQIIHSKLTTDPLKHLSAQEISLQIENILKHTNCFVLCVSELTLKSYHQTIEINNAIDSNKKIIYLIMDKGYSPANNLFAKSLVGKNKWLPFYTDEHVIECRNYLVTDI
jgi:hypothetical protein